MYLASLNQRIGDIAQKDFMSLDENTIVADAVRTMKEGGISSVFVRKSPYSNSKQVTHKNDERIIHHNTIVGIVTERDILYKVVGQNKGPYKVALKDVMSSPIITIDKNVSVKDAISLMRNKHIRRLLVTEKMPTSESEGVKHDREDHSDSNDTYVNIPIGSVTLMTVVGNLPSESVDLVEIESPFPGKAVENKISIVCPYCESKFEDKDDLSKHINQFHLESGLPEGKEQE
jgi:CBS domain-containing protein